MIELQGFTAVVFKQDEAAETIMAERSLFHRARFKTPDADKEHLADFPFEICGHFGSLSRLEDFRLIVYICSRK